ncbi:MAG: glycerate kinase [Eubacterium sp.]|nr:glycerate kinase [Eubacterium sp.]
MKLLFVSDSFKGSLSSHQTINLLTKAANEVFGPCQTEGLPVADGGEGTLEAIIDSRNGQIIEATVYNPLMEEIKASYGIFDDNKAIIQMASASGLTLIPKERQNPLFTSSFGTGQLILDALKKGYKDISIAIGGSATNDGGMGCARALGVRFLDPEDKELMGYGYDLEKVNSIDISNMTPLIKDAKITVMCDVTNPLCGPNGATYTFSSQKGADNESMEKLEKGMCIYRDKIMEYMGINCDDIPGTGAAGGLGAALKVFFNGQMKSGIERVLDLIEFDKHLTDVDLIVTGEGCTDWQSCYGKVMQGVGLRAKEKGIPVIGLSGSMGKGAMDICKYGLESLMTLVNAPMTINYAIENAEKLYYEAAVRMFRFIKVGMDIK